MAKNKTIDIDGLAVEIAATLADYTEDVQKSIELDVAAVAKETKDELKNTSPKLTGNYAKGWAVQKIPTTSGRVSYRVYNKNAPHLTHLLEYGHKKVTGGMVRAIPHIDPANRKAQESLLKKIKESIQKA